MVDDSPFSKTFNSKFSSFKSDIKDINLQKIIDTQSFTIPIKKNDQLKRKMFSKMDKNRF